MFFTTVDRDRNIADFDQDDLGGYFHPILIILTPEHQIVCIQLKLIPPKLKKSQKVLNKIEYLSEKPRKGSQSDKRVCRYVPRLDGPFQVLGSHSDRIF